METILKIENIEKYYGNKSNITKAIDNISFSVEKGEYVAIMGASGSGKTTLLNCISCYIPSDSGKIELGDTNLATLDEESMAHVRNEKLGFVFQDFLLLDGLTIRDNIMLPRIIGGKISTSMEKSADLLCDLFGISHIKNKYPADVSGGEKQRTAVARALINNPELILADEPTGNLDSKSAQAVIDAFLRAKNELSATIFMVTHDSFAASFCDRVVILKDGNVRKTLVRGNQERRTFQDALLDAIRELSEVKGE